MRPIYYLLLSLYCAYQPVMAQVPALSPQVIQLKDVEITATDPLALIRRAIQRIPVNHYSQPHTIKGCYRLSAKKVQDYIHLSEAVFDLYCPDNTGKGRQFRLERARMEKDLSPFHGVSNVVFGVKPEQVFEYDVAGHIAASDVLGKQGLSEHLFSVSGVVDYNGRPAYLLEFDQREGLRKSRYQGRLYLDRETLAILSLRYWLSRKGIRYWEVKQLSQRALMKLLDIYETVLQDTVQIDYQQVGDKYFLQQVSNRSLVRIHSGRVRFDFNCPVDMRYVVTGIDTVSAMPFKKEELLAHHRYVESQGTDDSEVFWKDHNPLPADYNFDAVAREIRARNKTLDYKRMLENSLRKYPRQRQARVDSILTFYHRKGMFDGVALVQYKGDVIYRRAFGVADKAQGIPNYATTKFRIGSVTKQFTAMMILQLEQEGKLQVTDTVGKYLPGYAHGDVTIAQLLTHQSGIPNCTVNTEYLSQLLTQSFDNDELVRRFCSDSLEFSSGADFRYSNSGYMVLSALIERVSGKRFASVLAEKICRPLGMEQTFATDLASGDTLMAIGYEGGVRAADYPVMNMAGAGAIISTADDLLKWEHALHSDRLLPLEQVGELFKPRAIYKDWGAAYGYGWMMDKVLFKVSKRHVVQYHPGTDMGFYSMLVRQPDEGVVIILLGNHGEFPRFDMTDLLLEQLTAN